MSDPVDACIASPPQQQRAIIRRLRAAVRRDMPGAHEMVYHAALGYSYSESPSDRIIYIAPAKRHVTCGFFYGGNLPDPNHLLERTGTRMRHVKVRSVEEAGRPALAALIRAAWKDAPTSIPKQHGPGRPGR